MFFIVSGCRDTRNPPTMSTNRWRRKATAAVLTACVALSLAGGGGGCSCTGQNPHLRNDLDAMKTADIQIKRHTFRVWLATTDTQRERGLMQVEKPLHHEGVVVQIPVYTGVTLAISTE